MSRKPRPSPEETGCPKRTKRGATRTQEGRAQCDDDYADSSKLKDDGEHCYDTR